VADSPARPPRHSHARAPAIRRARAERGGPQAAHPRRPLGPDALDAGEREFRVGDRVLCRRNDPTLGVRNGTRGTIVDLDPSALTLQTDAGQLRSLPRQYAEADLDHAYALTGHAAQGATVERAYVLLPDQGALHEWGYVTCSRARTETHLYLAKRDPLGHETPLRRPNPMPPPERAARALERSSADPLALDQSREGRDPTMRLLAQEREQTDRLHERTVERLHAAHGELQRLRSWNRAPAEPSSRPSSLGTGSRSSAPTRNALSYVNAPN
jgi:hypothetical protein